MRAAGRAVRYTPAYTGGFPHGGKGASCGRSLPPVSNPPLPVRGAAAIPAAIINKKGAEFGTFSLNLFAYDR